MNRAAQLIDEIRARKRWTSDYQLAKELAIPRPRISDYRAGRRKPDEFACNRFADALSIDSRQIEAEINAEWERDEKRRAYWVKKLEALAAMILVAVGMGAQPTDTQAAAIDTLKVTLTAPEAAPRLEQAHAPICIM